MPFSRSTVLPGPPVGFKLHVPRPTQRHPFEQMLWPGSVRIIDSQAVEDVTQPNTPSDMRQIGASDTRLRRRQWLPWRHPSFRNGYVELP